MMQTISEIRELLARRGLRPRQRFGQNFLHDQNQIRKLIGAADVRPGETVLEVGPGTGTLTEALLDAGASVVACEIDRDLADLLADRLAERLDSDLTLIRGDCLDKGRRLAPAVVEALGPRPFKLIANLPYNAASPLMTALLLDHPRCQGQFITIQKEVADRLAASPGTKAYGPLGIIVQALAEVTAIGTIPPASFWPQPKVTSAMVGIVPRPAPSVDDAHAFARFVTDLFSKRRKQLGSILGRDAPLPRDVAPDARPESLSVAQLVALHEAMRRSSGGGGQTHSKPTD